MNKNQLSVRLHGEQVGILEQTLTGKMEFTYDDSATLAISIGMPIREQPYDAIQTEAFFGGLLPESSTAKKIIGQWYGISPHNNFALLTAIGLDCAGAISLHPMNEPIVPQHSYPLSGKILSEDELYFRIKELDKKPLFLDNSGLKISLAGAQAKAAVSIIDNKIALPENACPTTHILKPSPIHLDGLADNEYFCLKIAKRIGLPVPNIELRQIKDITFLLIERYDRRIQNNNVTRIHQEDICQALNILSAKKYQNEGGPNFKNCFGLLKYFAQPIDHNLLASALVFNYLICNMDAHGKNFSLLHDNQSNIHLAPFYDIICTRVYQELSSKMAMKIGSKYDVDNLFPRHWEQLCEDIGYNYIEMQRLIKSHSMEILSAAAQEKEEFIATGRKTSIIDKIINTIQVNISRTLKQFAE